MLAKLPCHKEVQITTRGTHAGRHLTKVAAVRISGSIETDMDPPPDDSLIS